MFSNTVLLDAQGFDLNARSWADNEQRIIDASRAADGAVALMFTGRDGIVVPRSYRAKHGFDAAAARLASGGIPVWVRLSGGGVVPQSAGTVNFYLAFPTVSARPLDSAETHYLWLCRLLQRLFAAFGIETAAQTVDGSFCDGRFNLAANGRKTAGTAQCWQRRAGVENGYTVLLSAVILCSGSAGLTERANLLESALGSGIGYLPEKTADISLCRNAETDAQRVCGVLAGLVSGQMPSENPL